MTNTAENLILDRFSDDELMKAEPTALLALAKELREQRDVNDRARASAAANLNDMQRNQDRLADALMIVLGDPIEALIESKIEASNRDDLFDGFDIDDYRSDIEYWITDAIDERVGEPESEDDRHAAVEEIVKDVISGASISIDL